MLNDVYSLHITINDIYFNQKNLVNKVIHFDKMYKNYFELKNKIEKEEDEKYRRRNQYIFNYEKAFLKLELQLKAEEISNEEFGLKIADLKSQLLNNVWDISDSNEIISNKLLKMGLITNNQKKVADEYLNEISDKKKNDEKKMYVDYILLIQNWE